MEKRKRIFNLKTVTFPKKETQQIKTEAKIKDLI